MNSEAATGELAGIVGLGMFISCILLTVFLYSILARVSHRDKSISFTGVHFTRASLHAEGFLHSLGSAVQMRAAMTYDYDLFVIRVVGLDQGEVFKAVE